MQTGSVLLGEIVVNVQLPNSDEELMPGVKWGAIEAFPTPAHWAYLVFSRRVLGTPIRYKLGSTLLEEVGACLLGGHGIPANVGVAAFEALKKFGAFTGEPHSVEQCYEWLSEPIVMGSKAIKYRFAKQKAIYLASALDKFSRVDAPLNSGRALRDWLLDIQGIGHKTASWVARNWLQANDVAILDIHILRAGILGNFFDPKLTVERHYLKLEEQFLMFSQAMGVPASELDAEMWWQMSIASSTVHGLLNNNLEAANKPAKSSSRTKQRHTNADQTALFV